MGKIDKVCTCKHELWELIEDSGYWMFQCLGCGTCHEIDDIPLWMKKDILSMEEEARVDIRKLLEPYLRKLDPLFRKKE